MCLQEEEADPLVYAKKIISGTDFKKRLISLEQGSSTVIAGSALIKEHYASNPAFTLSAVGNASPGSEKLLQWISGVLLFVEKSTEVIAPIKASCMSLCVRTCVRARVCVCL